MKKIYCSLTIILFALRINAQTATFNITYTGFTTQAQGAFQYAANIWAHTIISSVPIKVTAHFFPLTAGTLGVTFPNGVKNFTGVPITDTWYATSLANSITGVEQNPGQQDIEIYLNSSVNWYLDTTGSVPGNKYDFATVVLHELCHGLGFVGLAKKTGVEGSFGLLQQSDFGGLVLSFPWPDLDTLPSVFDHLLANNLSQQLDTFTNPSNALGVQFTNQNIFFTGTNATASNAGTNPKIYAPATFSLGSSMVHLDEATYPAGNPNELMTPNGSPGYKLHSPGPICIGVLKDIGWNINPNGLNDINANENSLLVFPNPVEEKLNVVSYSLTGNSGYTIFNSVGEKVMEEKIVSGQNKFTTDVSALPEGIYFIVITAKDFHAKEKFIKE